VILVSIETMLI